MPITADPAALLAAVQNATAGEVIEIDGDFGGMQWTGVHAPDVIIRSIDPPTKRFGTFHMHDCSGITFEDVFFDYPGWPGMPSHIATIYLTSGCNSLHYRNCRLRGNSENGGKGYAFHIINGNNFTIENCSTEFHKRAVNLGSVDDIDITGCHFSEISTDGINYWQVRRSLIENNTFEKFKPSAGAHPDCIQLHSGGASIACEDVTIRGNFFNGADCTVPFQVIFLGNPSPAPFYNNIVVEDNLIFGAHIHGISIERINGFTCRNNTLLSATHSSPFVGHPGINFDGASTIAENSGNVGPAGAVQYQLAYGTPSAPNSAENNFVNPHPGTAGSLADFQAIGEVAAQDLGAPMTQGGAQPPVNSPPNVIGESYTIDQDTVLAIPVADLLANDTDLDGDALTITAVQNAVNGTVTMPGDVVFTPDAGFFGAASFDYVVSDGTDSNVGTVSVTVNQVVIPDIPPTVPGASYTIVEDNPWIKPIVDLIAEAADDPDGDPITLVSVQNPVGGAVSMDATNVVFIPTINSFGQASFEMTIEASGVQASGTINITVTEFVGTPPPPLPQPVSVEIRTITVADITFDDGSVETDIPVG